MSALYEQLEQSKAAIEAKTDGRIPKVGLILGSGLGAYANTLEEPISIDYGDIPNFPVSNVSGHAGRLVVGDKHGVTCAAMQGRVHFYEGHDARTLVFPARTLIRLGCEVLIITNAAGGISYGPGTLMVIKDHLSFMPDHPLRGENDERLGPRFPDMSEPYSKKLQETAHSAAASIGIELGSGVYAAMPGPAYETPAEIRMLRTIGADAAGMSTVPEVIAANHMGAKVLGLSCITNHAAGLSDSPLSHDEVKETAEQVHDTFISLLDAVIKGI